MLHHQPYGYGYGFSSYPTVTTYSLLLNSRYSGGVSRCFTPDFTTDVRSRRIDPSGGISRGRSVVKIKNWLGGGGARRRVNPGQRLVEKFIIRDPAERSSRSENKTFANNLGAVVKSESEIKGGASANVKRENDCVTGASASVEIVVTGGEVEEAKTKEPVEPEELNTPENLNEAANSVEKPSSVAKNETAVHSNSKSKKKKQKTTKKCFKNLEEIQRIYEEVLLLDETVNKEELLNSGWEEIEIEEEMEKPGGTTVAIRRKKKVIVKKKGSKIKVTPLEAVAPAVKSVTASPGDIHRQLSKKRLSLADENLTLIPMPSNLDRKVSITDDVIVEESAYFDKMIKKEMRDRRKSSLAFPPPELVEEKLKGKKNDTAVTTTTPEESPTSTVKHAPDRREQWKALAAQRSVKSLGKFYKPQIRESDSEEESSDEDSDSGSNGTEIAPGRVSPPAKTLPRFKSYSINDFTFLKVLGKGSFGKVLLAELKGSECYYAVKCLKKDVVLEDDDVECTMIERKVLALGSAHPYFCHLFCTFQTESHLFFVMEYLNGGDLMFHIQQSGRFDEGRARFYAAEIVCALSFLHKWGIVYRDLKLDNVLLDFDGHVRIADFGMCKLQIYLDRTTDTFCGTPDYMAPEVIKGLKYNQCVDWWSFGILLYEMLVGQSPFSGCDEDHLFWSICNERPHMPRYLSSPAVAILTTLLEKDWTKRLGSCENGASEVMNHRFFEGLKWHLLERRQLDPPFKPMMKHPLDTKYFDRAFTCEKPVLTPVDRSILESMDQGQFEGFSYTNPNATE